MVTGSSYTSDAAIDEFNVTGVTAIDEDAQVQRSVNIYPNPTTDLLNIELLMETGDNVETTITLIDLHGRVLRTADARRGTASMDMSELANGIYFVRFISDDMTVTKKVIKQ